MIDLLSGVRVLESGSLLCVDLLGFTLASLGADVIKVESPGRGDYLRDMLGQMAPHVSPAHVQANANKRSVTVDLKSPEGLDVFWDLFETCDVFITGNVGDICDRLGIGYEAQRRRKPEIVFAQFTGFGAHGPYASIATHGYSMNSLAADWPMTMGPDGLMHVDRSAEVLARKAPDATVAGAVWASTLVAAALVRARRTGEGQYLDVGGADAVLASCSVADTYALNEDRITDWSTMPPPGEGRSRLRTARANHHATADGRVVYFEAPDAEAWADFCQAVDRPDLVAAEPAGPGAGADDDADDDGADDDEVALRRVLAEVFAGRTAAAWMALAAGRSFVCAPAHRDLDELRADPQLDGRGIFVDGEHPLAGPFTYVGVPVVASGRTYEVVRPAPALGEHTDEVLAEIGYDRDRIEGLRAARAI